MSGKRLVELYDHVSAFEAGLLEMEKLLREPELQLRDLASRAGDIQAILPSHRGFARERALRMTRLTVGLHTHFQKMRREFGILHRQISKIKRDGEALFLPSFREPGAQPVAESDTPMQTYGSADYVLLRLGTMRFCIFDHPIETLRDVRIADARSEIPDADFFPGFESIDFFAPGKERLNLAIFRSVNGKRPAIWFEENLPPIISKENRVQIGSAGIPHPLIRGRFKFKGADYYILRVDAKAPAPSERQTQDA